MEEEYDPLLNDYKYDMKFGTKVLVYSSVFWSIVVGTGLLLIQTGHNVRLLMIIGHLFGWGILIGFYYLGRGFIGYLKNKYKV